MIKSLFEERKKLLKNIISDLNKKHGDYLSVEIKDQYFNMREKIEPVFHVVEIAKDAMEGTGHRTNHKTY